MILIIVTTWRSRAPPVPRLMGLNPVLRDADMPWGSDERMETSWSRLGNRALRYFGLRIDDPAHPRSWLRRVGNPALATSNAQRWVGVLIFALLAFAAISDLFRGSLVWTVLGVLVLVIALVGLVRSLAFILQRRPLS